MVFFSSYMVRKALFDCFENIARELSIFPEKYKINITQQVISRVIGIPAKFKNLSVEALRRKRIIPIVNSAAGKFSVLNYQNIQYVFF